MSDSKKIEKICTEDGLQGEKVVYEEGNKVVTEFYIEDPRPKPLKKRVVETKKEIVAERKIETIKDGQVVESQLESLEPQVKPQLVEHIRALSADGGVEKPSYVTREELKDMISEIKDVLAERPVYSPGYDDATISPMQAESEQRVAENGNTFAVLNTLILAAIAGLAVAGAYVFFMV